MFEVFFIACMLSNPSHCEEVRLAEAFEGKNIGMCYAMSQPKVADFMKEHPGWFIKRYGCEKEGTKSS